MIHILLVVLVSQAPCLEAAPIGIGNVAGCDGMLVPRADATRCLECLTVDLRQCVDEAHLAEQRHAIRLNALEVQLASAVGHASVLSSKIRSVSIARPDPWWRHPSLWFVAGAAAALAADRYIDR